MLLKISSFTSRPLLSSIFKPPFSLPKLPSLRPFNFPCTAIPRPSTLFTAPRMSWLNKFGFGLRSSSDSAVDSSSSIAQGPDDDIPSPGQEFAQFGAGCFWGPELAYQRVPGVTKTEVGYTHGYLHNPTYEDVCTGTTNHSEVVRVQYDPKECSYEALLDVFWARHDPTTLNRQVVGIRGTTPDGCELSYTRRTTAPYWIYGPVLIILVNFVGGYMWNLYEI